MSRFRFEVEPTADGPLLSVDVPVGWELATGEDARGALAAVVRRERRQDFNANLLIFADELPPGTDLADWVDENLDNDEGPGGVDLEGRSGSERIGTIAGRPSVFRLVHLTARTETTAMELVQTQVFTTLAAGSDGSTEGSTDDGTELVVQLFGTSQPDDLEHNGPVFTAIARSLRCEPR